MHIVTRTFFGFQSHNKILDIPEDLPQLIDAPGFLSCNNAACCVEAMRCGLCVGEIFLRCSMDMLHYLLKNCARIWAQNIIRIYLHGRFITLSYWAQQYRLQSWFLCDRNSGSCNRINLNGPSTKHRSWA